METDLCGRCVVCVSGKGAHDLKVEEVTEVPAPSGSRGWGPVNLYETQAKPPLLCSCYAPFGKLYAFFSMIRTEMGLFTCQGECCPWDSAVAFGLPGVQGTGSNSVPHLMTRLEVPFLLLEPPSLGAGRGKVHIHPSRHGREISDHAEVMDP